MCNTVPSSVVPIKATQIDRQVKRFKFQAFSVCVRLTDISFPTSSTGINKSFGLVGLLPLGNRGVH